MKDEKLLERYTKFKKLSFTLGIVFSLLNTLLMIYTILQLWGIKITPQKIIITRQALLKYEIYIRWAITLELIIFWLDMFIFDYYQKKHATYPPKWYGVVISFLLIFLSCVGYYVYQLPIFMFYSILGVLSLTYYLTLYDEYQYELSTSKIIKSREQ